MKTLFLMRHAKSDWNDRTLSDFDRPLNHRGFRAAPLIAEVMKKRGFLPDLILSSPALRAKTTAELVRDNAEVKSEIRFESGIYEASVGNLMTVLQNLENEISSVLLVGHNPGMESLSRTLTGELLVFPTAALVKISLEIEDWTMLRPLCGKIELSFKPRDIET